MADTHVVGDLATLTNIFRDADEVPTDPTNIALAITTPSGATSTYTYALAEIVKDGPGVYHRDHTVTEPGTWSYVWSGAGALVDVKDGQFHVWATATNTLYASVEDLKAFKNETRSTDDWAYRAAVTSASRAVDNFCHRRFYLDAGATARTYRATSGDGIRVDDIGVATGLVVATDEGDSGTYDTTWALTSDYVLEPTNAAVLGDPITKISGVGGRWFPTGGRRARVRVTARWGWPTVPDPVFEATLLLANRLLVRKDAAHGVAGFNDFGVIRIAATDADVQSLLSPYRALERTFA